MNLAEIRTTVAGQADAALSSLTTLAVAVYAVRQLAPDVLGAYTLLFTAFVIVSHLSTQLIFVPSEIDAIRQPLECRIAVLESSVRRGMAVAVPAAIFVTVGALPVLSIVDPFSLRALTITAAAAALMSPVQDHIRRTFHLAGRSTLAASVSGTQMAVALVAMPLIATFAEPVWVPFGALAVANAASIALGLLAAPAARTGYVVPQVGVLLRSGRWLVVSGVGEPGLTLVALSIVSAAAGPAALGFAEGARVVAQPLIVVSMGLAAVYAPRAIQAAQGGLEGASLRIRRRVRLLVAGFGGCYFLVVAFPGPWNPMSWLVPTAYEVRHLVIVAFGSAFLMAFSSPLRWELLGWGQERWLSFVVLGAGIMQVGAAVAASSTGAYAIPIASSVAALTVVTAATRRLSNLYRSRMDSS